MLHSQLSSSAKFHGFLSKAPGGVGMYRPKNGSEEPVTLYRKTLFLPPPMASRHFQSLSAKILNSGGFAIVGVKHGQQSRYL
jgi:hypothetical protein